MGSFQGHALPGSFFIIGGIWWTIQILRRYFTCQNNNTTFISSATVRGFPLDAAVKIFFTTAGLIIEIFIAGNMQHSTMYFFFGLTGIVDLLLYFSFNLPKDLDYVSLCLAIVMEGILFKFHLFGRHTLDILVHTVLLYILAATFFTIILEVKFKTNVLASLLRPYFFILQGTWFWQVGYILYNPFSKPWNREDHHNFMKTGLILTWHCGIIFVAMLCTFCLFSRLYKQKSTISSYKALDSDVISDIELDKMLE